MVVDLFDRSRFRYYSTISGNELPYKPNEKDFEKWQYGNAVYCIETTKDATIRWTIPDLLKQYG